MEQRVFTKESFCAVKPSPWGRLLRALPNLFLVALLFACAGPGTEGTPTGNPRYLADVPVLAFPTTGRAAPSRVARVAARKWVGSGARDVCGNSWAIEITVDGNKVTGEFWLRTIKYDIIGFLDHSGRMDGLPARKSKFYRNHIGPRQMEFNATFRKGVAIGEHYFFYGNCLTPMRLSPPRK